VDTVGGSDVRAGAVWLQRATDNRLNGRPRAAEQAYLFALAAYNAAGDARAADDVRSDYRALLVELGRDKEAADLDRRADESSASRPM
jgi:hypothetical protein